MSYVAVDNNVLEDQDFRAKLLNIAHQAGDAIMAIYRGHDFGVEFKDDQSPVTHADLAANQIIEDQLATLTPQIPLISEENLSQKEDIASGATFWLIDPLDGTKEFIKKNDQFTVNIALIENSAPIFGVVYAPAIDMSYWGGLGIGAWKQNSGVTTQISVRTTLPKPCILASASHMNEDTQAFIQKCPEHTLLQAGSSLKICMLAEGLADIYPRFGPTCEWDTGAGDAVLRGAGGMLFQTDGSPLLYGKDDIMNPHFIGAHSDFPVVDYIKRLDCNS